MQGQFREQMQKQRKKMNNGGFTLVEMIVVVLIIGIIATTAVMSFSAVNRAKANGCADRLAKLLDQTRGEAMSRVEGAVSLVISKRDSAYYGTLYINGTTEKNETELGDGSLSIEFYDGGTLVCAVDETHSFTICFQKGSGAFLFRSPAYENNLSFSRIVITGSNTRTIEIYEETGRYQMQ